MIYITKRNSNIIYKLVLFVISLVLGANGYAQNITIKGKIVDSDDLSPIAYASIKAMGENSKFGISSNTKGEFTLSVPSNTKKIQISYVGYHSEEIQLSTDKEQYYEISLFSSNTIETVTIRAPKRRYSNKNNPAVELIRKVIEHRDQNRLTGQDFAEFNQYEKIVLGLSNLDEKFKNRKAFKNYQFLFQEDDSVKDSKSYLLPAFIKEKYSKVYYSKDPKRSTQHVIAEKQGDFDPKFVDNDGLNAYFDRLYDEVEIYDNNISLLTNQFLSPIANSAPTFYRFYITDTIKTGEHPLVELSFVPRNGNDLLFKGKLYVTLDGSYAVQKASLTIDKSININFVRNLYIDLAFEKDNNGKYYLSKSSLDMDFALGGEKSKGIRGKRIVIFDDYKSGIQQPDSVHDKTFAQQIATSNEMTDWSILRPEPLAQGEAVVYNNIAQLNAMPSFKRIMDYSAIILSGYKQAGPVEIGPINTFYSYNPIEGLRLRLGGRTNENLSKLFYLEGYGAYGFNDEKWKYFISGTYSLNQKSPYRFPQHFIRVSASHDTKIPGQNLEFIQEDNILLSFKRGENRSYIYNDMYRVEYKAEFEGNFAVTTGLSTLKQQPAGSLSYRHNFDDGTERIISALNTTELSVGLRYAPHEEFYQGKTYRTPIINRYPILSLHYTAGIKGLLGGDYSYHNVTAGIFKRFYLSQMGYADVNLDGSYILGNDLPFPLLSIHRANQTYAYQLNSYNLMNFLEFVSDHHASLNIQYYMNGFLFNKIPLLKHLKLREVFSFKGIYGGLRQTNNPDFNDQVYSWQRNLDGDISSFTFSKNVPYAEASVGVANIFKILRIDAVKRINYLDHPNAPSWGVRARFKFDF